MIALWILLAVIAVAGIGTFIESEIAMNRYIKERDHHAGS